MTSTIPNTIVNTVTLGIGSYTSPLTITSTGGIAAQTSSSALIISTAGTVTNAGHISGGAGVNLGYSAYGTTGNNGSVGVNISAGALANSGTITGGTGGLIDTYYGGGTNGAGGAGVTQSNGLVVNSGVIAGGTGGSAPSAGNPVVQAQIASAVEANRAFFGGYGGKNPVPGVLIGVWDSTGSSYIHAFGYADLATHRKLTPQDHFRIGSITKTFVATVILQLVDEGKLNLDDPLSKFNIGIMTPNAKNITVRDLLDMRSAPV